MVETTVSVFGGFAVGVVVGLLVARRDRAFRVDWRFSVETDDRAKRDPVADETAQGLAGDPVAPEADETDAS